MFLYGMKAIAAYLGIDPSMAKVLIETAHLPAYKLSPQGRYTTTMLLLDLWVHEAGPGSRPLSNDEWAIGLTPVGEKPSDVALVDASWRRLFPTPCNNSGGPLVH